MMNLLRAGYRGLMADVWVRTVCSNDHFQHYIPIFCHTVLKTYPEYKIFISLEGKLDDISLKALEHLKEVKVIDHSVDLYEGGRIIIREDCYPDIVKKKSTFNLLRFLDYDPVLFGADYVFMTDIDFLWFPSEINILEWHLNLMRKNETCFAAHHGPRQKPRRFPGGWKGDRERVSGGCVMVTPKWYFETSELRGIYLKNVFSGEIDDYREVDEVMLCRLIKRSGLPVPQSKYFPQKLRGVHLGDFKESMTHRFTNLAKMRTKLDDKICAQYIKMTREDETWDKIYNEVTRDPEIKTVFDNFHSYLEKQRFDI